MRVFIQSPDNAGRIDGALHSMLLSGFADLGTSMHDCDVVLIPVSRMANYLFNPTLRDIRKPIVILDYLEYEWNCEMQAETERIHFLGRNTRNCRWLDPHWWDLCYFVRDNPPAIYFKRELAAAEVSDKVKPIDWPCHLPETPTQSETEFNARPFEVFFSWGYSHPSRPMLHGDIFHAMTTHGIGVVSEFDQFDGYLQHPSARSWVSIFSPHYARKPMTEVARRQQQAKISVVLPGCGRKCFRHGEAPVGSIMALPHDDLAWSYEWESGENCVRFELDNAFNRLCEHLKRDLLYQIYLRGQETVAKYRTAAYVQDYLTPIIEGALK